MSTPENGVLSTTSELMSLQAFHGTIWALTGLCVVVFFGRLWVRWISLGRLVAEDFIMLIVLCLLLADAIITQIRLRYVYEMEEVGNGLRQPPLTFLEDVPKGLRGLLALQILTSIGLWGVKFNFLLFFYRIFCAADRLYRRLWWVVVVVTVLCLGAFLGDSAYKCTASDVEVILTECTYPSQIRLEWIQVQTSSAIDAFNDALIMIFPIAIVWRVKISLRKKLYLSLMFMVTLLTIAMAIIRGTISYGRLASDYSQSQNISWIWFWLQMELIVSFLVACLVSFRVLFTQTKAKPKYTPPNHSPDQPATFGGSWKPKNSGKKRNIYDSLVDTCIELEGISDMRTDHSVDSERTHIASKTDTRTQTDAVPATDYHHDANAEEHWQAWGRMDDRQEMPQNVNQAHFRP